VIAAQPTFQPIPMLLALSVTDQDGAMVEQLPADAIRVGYQELHREATEPQRLGSGRGLPIRDGAARGE
jgi:hypothetical protein